MHMFEGVCSSDIASQMDRAIVDYRKIKALHKFSDEVAYQMETTMLPYSIVQWRPFRRKEYADFAVDDVEKVGGRPYNVSLVFGITRKEGVYLMHYPHLGICDDFTAAHHGNDLREETEELLNRIGEESIPENVAVSLGGVGSFAKYIDRRNPLPRVILLNQGLNYLHSRFSPWQTHDSFRLMERTDVLIGVTPDAPFKHLSGKGVRYWSDGRKGLLVFDK
ncbi:hypothetical protein HZB01_01920 [Candidatus Woesearchaeota archaeon]|nr:hypothetical protein [Candidatus Woesearchaeota archaeon]